MKQKNLKITLALFFFIVWTWLTFESGKIMQSISSSLDGVAMASYKLENLIVLSRSPDWKYGTGFYVAVVYARKNSNSTYDVECRVHVGNANYMERIELGQVNSIAEAMDKWGTIMWTDHNLVIGKEGIFQRIIAREQIERHR